ncbi:MULTISPECIES: hypothetical protein [Rhizobium]|uniref:hypothetical protein n=1 Tax=Rhizobium TaxID=379 RepID=UPI001039F910|nr:hypothetical protein [Rhizobium leguminosarum]TBZ99698.1 hypothetical protein E0H57_27990 [Rhizobium leguminosarum bv. viciae]UFW76290.1 hypothetical protein RlegSU303_13470 [Rhizobium leguminosarum bv. viciae]
MQYEVFETIAETKTYQIAEVDIDDRLQPVPDDPVVGRDWLLGLVNMSNECFVLASTTDRNGNFGKWFAIPTVCKNCTSTYDHCSKNKGWDAILSTACTSPSFSIRIATKPDQSGNASGAEFPNITPKCNYAGGLIGIY